MNLSDVSLLVVLNISQWTARKYDKEATRQIAAKHGIDSVVGRYNKSLLPMTDELNAITNYGAAVRMWFYSNTLPYTYEGVRLLPSRDFFEFMQQMDRRIGVWKQTVEVFISHYQQHVDNAKDMLGPLYNTQDYPAVDEIRNRFNIEFNVSPVPDANGFFNILADDMAKEMADKYIKTARDTEYKAVQDCWNRLYTVVLKFSEKLANDSASLREDHVQSMLDNAKELCILLEKLNITNDPNLEAMRLEVDKELCRYSAGVLSSHELSKQEVRESAENIMRKMSAFMGGAATS